VTTERLSGVGMGVRNSMEFYDLKSRGVHRIQLIIGN
jgi:hypothetical protein